MIVDLHSHLIPGVDDGAQTIEDTILLGKIAEQEGVSHIVLTPHHNNNRYINKAKDVREATKEVQNVFIQEGINVKVTCGQEIRIRETFVDDYLNEELLSLDSFGKYYLIEFPTMTIPEFTYSVIRQLINRGITPVIAHPERNIPFAKDMNVLYSLIDMGCLGQLTTTSLVGGFGREIEELSSTLIEHNLVHILASDVHHPEWRPYNWKQSMNKFQSLYGIDLLNHFMDNAALISQGENISKLLPEKIKQKSHFNFLPWRKNK